MTLFRDSKHAEYEDKEWVFVIEDVSVVAQIRRGFGGDKRDNLLIF